MLPFWKVAEMSPRPAITAYEEVMEHSIAIKVVPRADVLECNGVFFVLRKAGQTCAARHPESGQTFAKKPS